MYNLIIDLEMCNVPRDYRRRSYKYANETIQIGAVLLDENFKRISTLCFDFMYNLISVRFAPGINLIVPVSQPVNHM